MSKQKKLALSKAEGLIPELRFSEFAKSAEWEVKMLGEIGKFIGGGTPDTTNKDYWNGDILWFTPTEVKEGKLIDSKRKITKEGLENSSAKLLPAGTLLITSRATIGDVGIATVPCTTNQGFQSLVVNENQNNVFWYYWLALNKNELIKRSSGSTFPEIGKNEIIQIPALVPTKPEQQKIASCLSSLDELIEAHSQKLELLKDHKKGLMQNLFPQEGKKVPKLRFKGFKGEWEEKTLVEIYSFKVTNSFSRDNLNYENGEVKNIHYGDIHKLFRTMFDITREKVPFINSDLPINKIAKENYCKEGDMIFADASEDLADIGKAIEIVNLNNEKLVSGLHTLLARPNLKDLSIGFGAYLFQSLGIRKQIQKESQGTKVLSISATRLSNISILLPSKPEQQIIASCLSALDELITAQAEKIEQLKQHKKGLMQGLFPKMND